MQYSKVKFLITTLAVELVTCYQKQVQPGKRFLPPTPNVGVPNIFSMLPGAYAPGYDTDAPKRGSTCYSLPCDVGSAVSFPANLAFISRKLADVANALCDIRHCFVYELFTDFSRCLRGC